MQIIALVAQCFVVLIFIIIIILMASLYNISITSIAQEDKTVAGILFTQDIELKLYHILIILINNQYNQNFLRSTSFIAFFCLIKKLFSFWNGINI